MDNLLDYLDGGGVLLRPETFQSGRVDSLEIAVCGLNHRTAPVAILEKLAFTPEKRRQALAELAEGDWLASEAAILSTCNRVELYASLPQCGPGPEALAEYLAAFHSVPLGDVAPYLYTYTGDEAVRHLLRVASGLDSLILGEPQILGQVRVALEAALEAGTAGTVLSALLRRAIQTGKRAHTETGISQGAASVSYAAVETAARQFGDLSACHALVIGAGKTGQLAATCLLGRGVRHITVANRSYEHAAELARSWDGAACTLGELDGVLPAADIVISATNAPGYVVSAEQVRGAQMARAARPLLLVDIAMPRDIDPDAAQVPGVVLRNIDDLHQVIAANLDQRRSDGARAEEIVALEAGEFMAWFKALAVAPVITDLREQADAIRRRELERARHRLTPTDVDLVDMLTQRIVNQLLHQPTVRLKEHACHAEGPLYAEALRDLFGLDGIKSRE